MITWLCHICGKERPDDKISVFSSVIELGGGVEMTQNVRYCNDNLECVEAAKTYNFIKDK